MYYCATCNIYRGGQEGQFCPKCGELLVMVVPHVSVPQNSEPTIRDQFAMAALTGFLASTPSDTRYDPPESMAKECYDYAEAMLKERAIKRE